MPRGARWRRGSPGGHATVPGCPAHLSALRDCCHRCHRPPPPVSLFLTFPVPPSLSRATLSSLHLCHFPLGGAWPLRSQAGRSRPGPALPGSRLSLSPLLPLLSSRRAVRPSPVSLVLRLSPSPSVSALSRLFRAPPLGPRLRLWLSVSLSLSTSQSLCLFLSPVPHKTRVSHPAQGL